MWLVGLIWFYLTADLLNVYETVYNKMYYQFQTSGISITLGSFPLQIIIVPPLEKKSLVVIQQRRSTKKWHWTPLSNIVRLEDTHTPSPPFTNVQIVSFRTSTSETNAKEVVIPTSVGGGVGHRYGNSKVIVTKKNLKNSFVDIRSMVDPSFAVVHIGSHPPPPYLTRRWWMAP